MDAFLHGLLLAFGLILPIGVQNLFLLTQGVNQPKFRYTLPAVVTAALCDTVLIVISIAGLSLLVLQFEMLRSVLIIGGVVFLTYMGWVIWRSPVNKQVEGRAMSGKKQVLFALSVSLLNPHALLDTIGVIGTSSMKYVGVEQLYFGAACILVSWVWFFGLAFVGSSLIKLQIQEKYFIFLNKISAIFIWVTVIILIQGLLESVR